MQSFKLSREQSEAPPEVHQYHELSETVNEQNDEQTFELSQELILDPDTDARGFDSVVVNKDGDHANNHVRRPKNAFQRNSGSSLFHNQDDEENGEIQFSEETENCAETL